MVCVGVDFVFPWKKEEGRKKKNNPHLAFSRRKDPTCLNFADGLVGVWRVLGSCLEGVWKGVWRVSMGFPNGNLVNEDW